MNTDVCLLNDIYQNVQMGMQSIPQLLQETTDTNFENALKEQLSEYQTIASTAQIMLANRKEAPKPISSFSRLSSYLMTEMKTMTDKSTSHMAEMMVQGNTMGMTNILRNMREHKDADTGIYALAERLLGATESGIRDMKAFL